MYSTHNEGKSVVAERFIKTFSFNKFFFSFSLINVKIQI